MTQVRPITYCPECGRMNADSGRCVNVAHRQPQREPEWMRRRRETGLKPKDMTSMVLG